MSNPTSNFGWQMPTNTDLVTNLPADFEVFGQAVDSSMADLKGGTTGQILSKATNADMDFVWTSANPGDITGVTASSPLTGGGTSGDVTVGIQDGTTAQKGAVQLTDSTSSTSTTTAATPNAVKTAYDLASTANSASVTNNNAAGKNSVINSGFEIWQRGTSFTSNGYTADRWYGLTPTNITISRQATSDTTNLPNIQYCVRLARSAGSTAAVYPQVTNSFETINSIPFAGKTMTLSFYARRGANFSASSNQISAYVPTGTGTNENVANGYTGETNPIGGTATLTTTWQRFTFTGTIPTTATEMGVKIFALTSGTAGAADYFEVTGVQLELGSTATAYSRNGATYQGELSACQRYYWRLTGASAGYYRLADSAVANSTTDCTLSINNPVLMRVTPTSVDYAGVYLENYVGAGSKAATSVTINTVSNPQITSGTVNVASGLTAGTRYFGFLNNNTSSYLGYSAEL